MKLIVKQSNIQEQVSSELIDKLYQVASGGTLTNDSDLQGSLITQVTYEDAVNYLREHFPNLIIAAGAYYIRFADQKVLEVLLNNGVGDGVGVSTTAAAGASGKQNIFKDNTQITSFDEIKYFTVQNLAGWVMSGCSNLRSIDIRNGIKLANNSFDQCALLEYSEGLGSEQGLLRLPEGVTDTGYKSWINTKFTKIVLPDSLTTISEHSFKSMSGLTDIYLGNGLTTWGRYSLDGDNLLKTVHVKNPDTLFNIAYDVICPFERGRSLYQYTQYGDQEDEIHAITVPNNVTRIPGRIFGGQTGDAGCLSLTSVTFHNNITHIGGWAFMNCKNLVIPDLSLPNLLELSSMSFISTKIQQISNLGSITIIQDRCFDGCSQLTRVVIPPTVQECKGYCFRGCTALQRIDISDMTKWVNITFGNIEANPLWCGHNLYFNDNLVTTVDCTGMSALKSYVFAGCLSLTSITNLESITSIPDSCFRNCSNLTSVTIPNSVTSIGNSAFHGCSNLVIQDLNLPNLTTLGSSALRNVKVQAVSNLGNITSIGNEAFLNCKDLASVVISNSVISIGSDAFYGCSGLTSITIPNSVTNIGSGSFQECSSLTSLTIGNSVTSIGTRAFNNCKSLTSVVIPNSVTSISGGAFSSCAAITSITIPDNVTSDVQEWFHSCDALTTVVLGSGITRIKAWAFRNDKALRSLTVKAVNPPVCEDNALAQSAIVGYYGNYCDIYVPAGSVDAYKTADGWSAAASRIQAIQE